MVLWAPSHIMALPTQLAQDFMTPLLSNDMQPPPQFLAHSMNLERKMQMEWKRNCGGQESGGLECQDALAHYFPPELLFHYILLCLSESRWQKLQWRLYRGGWQVLPVNFSLETSTSLSFVGGPALLHRDNVCVGKRSCTTSHC